MHALDNPVRGGAAKENQPPVKEEYIKKGQKRGKVYCEKDRGVAGQYLDKKVWSGTRENEGGREMHEEKGVRKIRGGTVRHVDVTV